MFVMITSFFLIKPGAFPEVVVDVALSNDGDDGAIRLPEYDAPTDQKVSAADGTEGPGTASIEALIPGLIVAGASGETGPLAADRVPTIQPSGVCDQNARASPRSGLIQAIMPIR
jgi:hypothetical protein